MELRILRGLILGICLVVTAPAHAGIIMPVVNGSFENPAPVSGYNNYNPANPGAVTGWSLQPLNNGLGPVGGGVWNVNASNFGLYPANSAPDGSQIGWIENSSMSQTVAAMGGHQFTLDFFVGTGFNRSPTFTAQPISDVSAIPFVSFTSDFIPMGKFGEVTISGLAPLGTNTVTIEFSSAGSGANSETDVDNVSLSATPEPGSLTLLGLGVIGIAGYGWSRRKNQPNG